MGRLTSKPKDERKRYLSRYIDYLRICSPLVLQIPFRLADNTLLDHLIIGIEIKQIDGVNGVLGAAGPCTLQNSPSNTLFTKIGGMIFDSADLNNLFDDGTLEEVVLHEMGHVLGIGTLWQNFGYLKNPVFNGNFLTNDATPPSYAGPQGKVGFEQIGGASGENIPVEDGISGNGQRFFPIGEGRGSIDGHWKKSVFNNELMTFSINANDQRQPLSIMTLKSLQDFGYDVDETKADAFSVPSTIVSHNSLRGPSIHYLIGDTSLHANKITIRN